MIHPSPTSPIHPTLARGTLVETHRESPTHPALVVIALPNSNYQVHLVPTAPITTQPGKRIIGEIHAEARRIDSVHTGGSYLEPVMGRPRRVQGRVLVADNDTRTLIVEAVVPVHCHLNDDRQKPSDFPIGELVSFDVLDGATFGPRPG